MAGGVEPAHPRPQQQLICVLIPATTFYPIQKVDDDLNRRPYHKYFIYLSEDSGDGSLSNSPFSSRKLSASGSSKSSFGDDLASDTDGSTQSSLRSPLQGTTRQYLAIGKKILLHGADKTQGLSALWTQEGEFFRLHLEGKLKEPHHLVVEGALLLSLVGLNLARLSTTVSETTFLGQTLVEDAQFETISFLEGTQTASKVSVAPGAVLIYRNLAFAKEVSLENHGTVRGLENGFVRLGKAQITNVGVWGLLGPQTWTGPGVFSQEETGVFEGQALWKVDELRLLNRGKIVLEGWGGTLSTCQNAGEIRAQKLDRLVIQNFENTGNWMGSGKIVLEGVSINRGSIAPWKEAPEFFLKLGGSFINFETLCVTCLYGSEAFTNAGRAVLEDVSAEKILLQNSGTLEAKTLTLRDHGVENTGELRAEILASPGKEICNDGALFVENLRVKRLLNLGKAHLTRVEAIEIENSGEVFLSCSPVSFLRCTGGGTFHFPSFSSPHLPEFLKTGRWYVEHMTLQETPGEFKPVRVGAFDLSIGKLTLEAHLENIGVLQVETLKGSGRTVLNTGSFTCSKKLKCQRLQNDRDLFGSGEWRITDQFLNNALFTTYGTHQLKAEAFTHCGAMQGVGSDSVFTFNGLRFINGLVPSNAPYRERTERAAEPVFGVERTKLCAQPVYPPTSLPIRSPVSLKTTVQSEGGMLFCVQELVNSRWGKITVQGSLEVVVEQGDILVGDYMPGPLRSAHSTSNRTRTGTNLDGILLCFPITYQGGQSNGGGFSSQGPLTLRTPAGAVRANYGTLASEALLSLQAQEFQCIATNVMAQEALIETPVLRIVRDQLYWSPYRGYVEAFCGGRWKWHRTFVSGSSPHDRSEASTLQIRGNCKVVGLINGCVESSKILAGCNLNVNGVEHHGKGSTILVYGTSGAQSAEVSQITGGQNVSFNIDDFRVDGALVGGVLLDINVRNLIGRSGRRENVETQALNLHDFACKKFPGFVTIDDTDTVRLTIPWGDETKLPTLAWLGHSETSISLAPSLMRFLMPHLVGYLGLDALMPENLDQFANNGQQAAREGLEALPPGSTAAEKTVGEETSLALPSCVDLQRVAANFGSFLFTQGRDVWLQPSPHQQNLIQAGRSSATTVLYGKEHAHITVQEHTDFEGVVVATEGEAEDAIRVQSGTANVRAATHSETHALSNGVRISEILDQPSGFLAPYGGAIVETQRLHTQAATLFATKKHIFLRSTEGEMRVETQTLHDKIATVKSHKRGGVGGGWITETNVMETTLEMPCQLANETAVYVAGAKGSTLVAPQIKTSFLTLDGGEGPVHLLHAINVQSSVDSWDKSGTFSNSSGSERKVEHRLVPAILETNDLNLKGQGAIFSGSVIQIPGTVQDTTRDGTQILTAKTKNTIERHYESSKLLQDREVIQEGGIDTLLQPRPQIGNWVRDVPRNTTGVLVLEGVCGKIERLDLKDAALTVRDATQGAWGNEMVTTSGLVGGPFQAEPLASALQNRNSDAHPFLQAVASAEILHAAFGVVQAASQILDVLKAGSKGILSPALSISQIFLQRYGTTTFGKQKSSNSFNQQSSIPSQLEIKNARITNNTFVKLQGHITGHNWYLRTKQFQGTFSLDEGQHVQTSSSRTMSINPFGGVGIGRNQGQGSRSQKFPSLSTLRLEKLDLAAPQMDLVGFEIRTHRGRAEIGEMVFQGVCGEHHEERESSGFSVNLSLNPVSYVGSQAAFTAATALSAQQEKKSHCRRIQTLGAGIFSVHPLTGRIQKLRTIGRETGIGTLDAETAQTSLTSDATTQASTHLTVTQETHEKLEEFDREDHTAFSIPLSTIGGMVSDGMWIREKLSSIQERIVRAEAEETSKKIISETLNEPQREPLSVQEKAQAEASVKMFMADAEVKEALHTVVRAKRLLIEARVEAEARHFQERSPAPSKPTRVVKASQGSPSAGTLHPRPSPAQTISVPNTDSSRTPEVTVSGVSRVTTEMKVQAAYEDVVVAQGMLGRAYGRFAREYPDTASFVSRAKNEILWIVGTGLCLWGYAEATATGVAVGGILGGPPGAIAGGVLGIIGANALDQTAGAATEAVLNKAYALSPTIGEFLELTAGVLMVRGGRKLLTRQIRSATTPALKKIAEPKQAPPPLPKRKAKSAEPSSGVIPKRTPPSLPTLKLKQTPPFVPPKPGASTSLTSSVSVNQLTAAYEKNGHLQKGGRNVETTVGNSSGLLTTAFSRDARACMRDVEARSGISMRPEHSRLLKQNLQQNKYRKLEGEAKQLHKDGYTPAVKERLKKEWSEHYDRPWPTTPNPKTGEPMHHQFHHIIPQKVGGPHEWWNGHPVWQPEHQGGVHGKNAPLTKILKGMDQ